MATELTPRYSVVEGGNDAANHIFGSLNAALADLGANHADLVAADKFVNIEISGAWTGADTTIGVIPNALRMSATCYVNIYATGTARHPGYYSTSRYRREFARYAGYGLVFGTGGNWATGDGNVYLRLDGIQLSRTDDGQTAMGGMNIFGYFNNVSGDIRVTNCINRAIITGTVAGVSGFCFQGWGAAPVIQYWNNMHDGWIRGAETGITAIDSDTAVKVWNNTFHNCYSGVQNAAAASVAVGNAFKECTVPMTGTFAAPTDCNITDVAAIGYTVTGGGNSHDGVNKTIGFVGAADFHLAVTDTDLIGKGVSDPGAGLFADDIDGVARGATWDCGADQYVASVQALIKIINE